MAEEDLLELLLAFLPESFEGWMAYAMAISAVLSYVLPPPAEDAHPVLRIGHKFICILGLGAAKIRTVGKLGSLFRKKDGSQK